MFLPGLIEHLEIVVAQYIQQVTQVHRVPLSLIVGEDKYVKHDLPAREHWTFFL